MIRALSDWAADETGASAVEMGLLLTPIILLLFGIVHLCLMLYSATQLNFATEATARCIVTSATSAYSSSPCYTSTLANRYFTSMYRGVTVAPTVTLCGGTFANCVTSSYACTSSTTNYQVTATANYVINAGVASKTVPLSAKACFPHT
jgi:Flp pilus assembly protein TadG